MSKEAIWYSYFGGRYPGNMPAFSDPAVYDWTVWAEENYERIRTDIETWLNTQGNSLKPYFHAGLVSRPDGWKVEPFYNWGVRNDAVCNAIPALDELFQRIDGLTSAALSKLEAGADIHPHYGDTNAILRCHFGLQVPGELPDIGIEVNGKKRDWHEGRWLMFCDAHKHRAWNHTRNDRYILIVDILLPEYRDAKDEVCANVRAMHAQQALEQRYPALKFLPGFLREKVRLRLKRKNSKSPL